MRTKTKAQGRKLYSEYDYEFPICYFGKKRKSRSGRSIVKQWYRGYNKIATRSANHSFRFAAKKEIKNELTNE